MTVLLKTERATAGTPVSEIGWFVAATSFPTGVYLEMDAEAALPVPVSAPGKRAALRRLGRVRILQALPPGTLSPVPPVWFGLVQAAMRRPLLPYQVTGAAWVAYRLWSGLGSLLADEQGLGKTTQAIAAIACTRAYPTLLVCPTSLKVNWADNEFPHATRPPSVHVVHGRKGPLPPAEVYVINYDLLAAREAQLCRLGLQCMVCDEAHWVNEPVPSTQHHRAAVVTRMAHRLQGRTVLLTGTPLENRPADYWRLLHMLDPAAWPDFESYRKRYCRAPTEEEQALNPELRHDNLVTDYGRVERRTELLQRVAPLILRRTKAEVQQDLPPKYRRQILVELSEEDRKVYETVKADVVAWLRAQGDGLAASAATRAMALVKLTHLRKIAAIGKLRHAVPSYLRGWFKGGTRGPLLIFCHHAEVLDRTTDIARRLGLRPVVIDGRVSGEERQQRLDDLAARRADLLIATIRTAGVGLNIQCVSDQLFLERSWVPVQMVQAEDRSHRFGQKNPVCITFLDAKDTVDEHIAAVLDDKQILIDGVMDAGKVDRKKASGVARMTEGDLLERFLAGSR